MSGAWVQLTSGAWYDFDKAEIGGPFNLFDDVALPMARAWRFACHTSARWSIVGHSICVARTVARIYRAPGPTLAALDHDMHESVIGDLSTPLGLHLGHGRIKRLKREVQCAMEETLDVPLSGRAITLETVEAVAEADLAALHVERKYLMAPCPRPWTMNDPDPVFLRIYDEEFTAYRALGRDEHEEAEDFVTEWHHLVHQLRA